MTCYERMLQPEEGYIIIDYSRIEQHSGNNRTLSRKARINIGQIGVDSRIESGALTAAYNKGIHNTEPMLVY